LAGGHSETIIPDIVSGVITFCYKCHAIKSKKKTELLFGGAEICQLLNVVAILFHPVFVRF
jgi:hypothetical protein